MHPISHLIPTYGISVTEPYLKEDRNLTIPTLASVGRTPRLLNYLPPTFEIFYASSPLTLFFILFYFHLRLKL